MMTASFLFYGLAWLAIMPVAAWVLGLVFRVLGWTMRVMFSVLGIFLLPVWLLLMGLGGLALAARFLIPMALVWLLASTVFSAE